MTAAACAFWFFAVMVWEPMPLDIQKGPQDRYIGGWSHSAPHATLGDCEAGRREQEAWSLRYGLKTRYRAGPCFRQTFKEYLDYVERPKPEWIRP